MAIPPPVFTVLNETGEETDEVWVGTERRMAASPPIVYHGAQTCQHPGCKNGAYWRVDTKLLCGVHSKRMETRVALPKDPSAAKTKLQRAAQIGAFVDRVLAACETRKDVRPTVRCYRMGMMGRALPLDTGCLAEITIFPNYKHGGRSDGVGMPALSPMSLGPIEHGEPGVVAAANLENYHQWSKCWPSEALPAEQGGGPAPVWFERRTAGFADPVPHRHKFDKEQMAKERALVPDATNPNQPLFAVHIDRNSAVRRFTYVESRAFYCCWYEVLAKRTSDFARLWDWHTKRHVSLCIAGYDGYPLSDDVYLDYCDDTKPFGHERVLAALLMGGPYPWRRYMAEHPAVYKGMDLPV